MITLNSNEEEIVNSILQYIPAKSKFDISSVHTLNVIAPKYKPQIIVYTGGQISGHDSNFEIEKHSLITEYRRITEFFLDYDFAEIDKVDNRLTLTDRGKKLKELGRYDVFLKYSISEQGRINQLETEAYQMRHRQQFLAEKQARINFWVAFGTVSLVIVALIQLLWDCWKFYHPFVYTTFEKKTTFFLVGRTKGYKSYGVAKSLPHLHLITKTPIEILFIPPSTCLPFQVLLQISCRILY